MNNVIKPVVVLSIVLMILAGVLSTVTSCCFPDKLNAITSCIAILDQPICLLCNTSKSSENVRWYVGRKKLADKGHNFDSSHAGGLAVNDCDNDEYYSLRLNEPSTQNHNSLYYCQHNKKNVSAFILNVRADAELLINFTLPSNGNLVLGYNESKQELQCVLKSAVPPLKLVWSINDVVKEEKVFNTSMDGSTTYSYTMNFDNLMTDDILTCSSEGMYIEGDSASIKIYVPHDEKGKTFTRRHLPTARPTKTEEERSNLVKVWIPIGLILVLLFSSLAIVVLRRNNKKNSFNMDGFSVPNVQSTGSTYEPYSQIGDVTRGNQRQSDDGVNDAATVSLLSKVKFSGIYEYWTGTYSTDGMKEENCFVKSLSGQSTLQEASEFQELAKKVKLLIESTNVVRVLCINIEKNPFSIAYELMEYGSLRDFVMSRYQQPQTSSPAGEVRIEIRELLTFATNVANAMIFVESQNFLHPILSLKKVLLTGQCCCKLYDIYPSDMAMMKIEKVRRKNHPPVAWMSPETIFLRQYSHASDVWSFSTLLWELFSFGEIPYAGKQEKEIEDNIRKGVLLKQPQNCPGAVYGIMLLAWVKNTANRPSFDVILDKLQDLMKSLEEEKTTDAVQYFTLEPSQTNEYI